MRQMSGVEEFFAYAFKMAADRLCHSPAEVRETRETIIIRGIQIIPTKSESDDQTKEKPNTT